MNIFSSLDEILLASNHSENKLTLSDLVNSYKYDKEMYKKLAADFIKNHNDGFNIRSIDDIPVEMIMSFGEIVCNNSNEFLKIIDKGSISIFKNASSSFFISMYPNNKYSRNFARIRIEIEFPSNEICDCNFTRINSKGEVETNNILSGNTSIKTLDDVVKIILQKVVKTRAKDNYKKYYKELEKYVEIDKDSLVLSAFDDNLFFLECIPDIMKKLNTKRRSVGKYEEKTRFDLSPVLRIKTYQEKPGYKTGGYLYKEAIIIKRKNKYCIEIEKNASRTYQNTPKYSTVPENLSKDEFVDYVVELILRD